MDRAQRKAKEEVVRRAQVRKIKQWMDIEWKEQMLEKLGKVDELVIQVWRVADALERIAGMRSKTLEDDIISWLESRGQEMETLERVDKRKGKEVVKEECDNKWSEMDIEDRGDGIEGVENAMGALVSSVWPTE